MSKGIPQAEHTTRWTRFCAETDVLYVTRVQKERFDDPAEYESVKGRLRDHPGDPARAPRSA